MVTLLRSTGVATLASRAAAAAAVLISPAGDLRWPWFALTCLSLVAAAAGSRHPALGAALAARALLAAGVIIHWLSTTGGPAWPLVAAGALLLGAILGEDLGYRAARPVSRSLRLPGVSLPAGRWVDGGAGWLVGSGAVALTGLAAALRLPPWLALVPAVAVAGGTAALLADAWRRRRTGHRAELAALRRAVSAHRPRFLLYFSAPPGSGYQVTMWLPYLERIGEPYLVVLAEDHHLPAVARATTAPVLAHRTTEALEAAVAPGVRAAFYVNFGMKNLHCIRFGHLTHVQLYHGYSDKPVSANPVAAVYDRIFVPGQAIVDRFAASGVAIQADRFRIVGRPQAEALSVAARPADPTDRPTGPDPADPPVVLYAPTWRGQYADSNHCSLPIGETIVAALLARGATVIVRPHPYTSRDPESRRRLRHLERLLARDRAATGAPHRWGRAAETDLDLAGCMNLSHALLCDVSSVASTYLYTGKPYAVTDMVTADGTFAGELPLAEGGYVLRRDAGNLGEVLDALLGGDPAAPARAALRTYYLGDFPADRYAEGFLTAARSVTGDGPDVPAGAPAGPRGG